MINMTKGQNDDNNNKKAWFILNSWKGCGAFISSRTVWLSVLGS